MHHRTTILTTQLQKVPLYSLLKIGEEVDIPQSDFSLLHGQLKLQTLTPSQLRTTIERSAYYGMKTRLLCQELVWKDPSIWSGTIIDTALSVVLRQELLQFYPGQCSAIQRCDRSQHYTCEDLAANGALLMLKWAVQKGYPLNEVDTFCAAAVGGHLHVLKWLHQQKYQFDERVSWTAATMGHLKVLMWLHQNACLYTIDTCWMAAKGGHLKVLKWLHSVGCPLDQWTYSSAKKAGNVEMLCWLHQNGFPQTTETSSTTQTTT